MTRTLAKCGTDSAYKRHLALGEPVDEACADAHNTYTTEWRNEQRRRTAARIARAVSVTGDELRVTCARLDAMGWPASRIAQTFHLTHDGARSAIQEGRRLLIARRRIGVS